MDNNPTRISRHTYNGPCPLPHCDEPKAIQAREAGLGPVVTCPSCGRFFVPYVGTIIFAGLPVRKVDE